MSELAWFFTIYGVLGLGSMRPLTGHFAWVYSKNDRYYSRSKPTSDQWWGGMFTAIPLAVIWPIAFLSIYLGSEGKLQIGEEKRAYKEIKREELKKLEKELDIGSR